MMQAFHANQDKAKSVDGASYIRSSGAYVGTLAQVSVNQTKAGATCVEIAFKSDEGLCFTQLYVRSKDGNDTFSMAIFQALMTVCGVETAPVVPATVFDRRSQKYQGFRVPALEGKRVGLVLQRENRSYMSDTGEIKDTHQMNLLTPFDPDTRMVAKEIIEGAKEAKLLDQRLKGLKDKDSRTLPSVSASAAPASPPIDDVPF